MELLDCMLGVWARAITGTRANVFKTNELLQVLSKHTQRGTHYVRTACDVAEAHVWQMIRFH